MTRFLPRALAALMLTLAPFAALAQTKQFLWEVTSLTNRVYLYGTIHAGKGDWYPLPEPVEKAFAASKVLAVEADITDTAAMAKSAGMHMLTAPDNLETYVGAADYTRFRKLLPKYSIPEAAVRQFKPFMAVSVLVFSEWGRLGYYPQYGVDGYLINKAKGEVKPIVQVEGVEAQSELIASLTAEENKLAFAGTLKALESGLTSEQITGMVNAWQSGDPNLLLEVARKYNEDVPGAKAFEEKFIWGRHDAMVKKIEGYLDSRQPHFVAVGALHLAGPRGLVELLRKRGYVVKQL